MPHRLPSSRILVVDPGSHPGAEEPTRNPGGSCHFTSIQSIADALAHLRQPACTIDVVLINVTTAGDAALGFLETLRSEFPRVTRLVSSAPDDLELVTRALAAGLAHQAVTPPSNQAIVASVLQRTLEFHDLDRERNALRASLARHRSDAELLRTAGAHTHTPDPEPPSLDEAESSPHSTATASNGHTHPAGENARLDLQHAPDVESTHGAGSVDESEWKSSVYRRGELFPHQGDANSRQTAVRRDTDRIKLRVLIADDEPGMRQVLRRQLEPGFEIIEAADGLQAIDMALQYQPDVVLCDLMMPELDGIQVCRSLRQPQAAPGVPFVLMTGAAEEATKIAALQAGATDFLSKPFSTSELKVRLKNLAHLQRSKLELADQKRALEATLEELKDTEVQLVQAEKLAGLGRMSAGIIHEINNPLNFANAGMYFLGQLSQKLPEPQRREFSETIHDVEDGLVRVAKIISDLRSFSHPGSDAVDFISVREGVESSLRFLAHEWRDRVRIIDEVPKEFAVRIDRNRFIQVLVNMFQNAFDAMETRTYEAGDAPELRIGADSAEGRRTVVIRDNGPGIPPSVLGKIFDPFFTTKEVGQGTGLGLSICHRIVRDAGGRIIVDSQPGKFTEFRLEFPAELPPQSPTH